MMRVTGIVWIILMMVWGVAWSQENGFDSDWPRLKSQSVRIFLDCSACDIEYIKKEIFYVNYVRERLEADVHILITDQVNAGGGKTFAIDFIGRKKFFKHDQTLILDTLKADTEDQIRCQLVEKLKLGLVMYIAQTPLSSLLNINININNQERDLEDKWNHWIFNLRLSSYYTGEESNNYYTIDSSASASRITPDIKVNLYLYGFTRRDQYKIENKTQVYDTRMYGLDFLWVKSLGDNWSVGGWACFTSSTYQNLKSSFTLAPAIEYNIFPYARATRQQISFLYKIAIGRVNYHEQTIFDKFRETLVFHSFSIKAKIKQPWGSIYCSFRSFQYFHDMNKYSFVFSIGNNVRLLKGLQINLSGEYSRINDQIFLSRSGLTEAQIVLRIREIATSYSFKLSFGMSFSFGSIFHNVVNPRFETGSPD